MHIDDLDSAYQEFVRNLITRFGFDPRIFPLEIAPADEMFFKAVLPGYSGRPGAAFFRFIESALRTHDVYRQLAEYLGGFRALDRVLDFASGYGRLTRALVQRVDRQKIWICDI